MFALLPKCLVEIIESYLAFRGECVKTINTPAYLYRLGVRSDGAILTYSSRDVNLYQNQKWTTLIKDVVCINLQFQGDWIILKRYSKLVRIHSMTMEERVIGRGRMKQLFVLSSSLLCFVTENNRNETKTTVCEDDTCWNSPLPGALPAGHIQYMGQYRIAHASSYSSDIYIWNLKTGICEWTMRGPRHVTSLLSLSNSLILAACRKQIWKFDISSGKCIQVFEPQEKDIDQMVTVGKYMISDNFKVWNPTTGKVIQVMEPRTECKFYVTQNEELFIFHNTTIEVWI